MPKLIDLVDSQVVILLLDPNRPGGLEKIIVKLLTVDDGGIWVENQELTDSVLATLNLPSIPSVLAMFFPYSAIHAIFGLSPGLSLSEKAFGA